MASPASMQHAVEQLTQMVEDAKSRRGVFGGSGEIKSGKDYDPTAAVREEKEKREKRHQAAMAKREEKERAECTFKPAVSRKSVELLQTIQKDRPALHTPFSHRTPSRYTNRGPEIQGTPRISEVSKILLSSQDRQGPIYERLLNEGEELKRRKELGMEEYAKQEASSVVGKPQINPTSAELVKRKNEELKPVGGTVERLTHAHIEKKKETIRRLEEQKQTQLAAETQYQVHTCPKSNKLAKKMEAEGNTAKQRIYTTSGLVRKSVSPNLSGSPASAPLHRNGSHSARSSTAMTPREVYGVHSPSSQTFPSAGSKRTTANSDSMEGPNDVAALRQEFERLVAQREETAAKAVAELEAAMARAREKDAAVDKDMTALKTMCNELKQENELLQQENKNLLTEVKALALRQKESDINEEHLNEKLKAITEKCQAVLVHNTKLQDQVNKQKALQEATVEVGRGEESGVGKKKKKGRGQSGPADDKEGAQV